MNKLEVNDKVYEYSNEVNVGKFQDVISLIHDVNEFVAEPNMTAGKFVGILSSKNKLISMVALLIDAEESDVEKFPINKAIEVCNNFFYTNGFWLMISNQFSMPSEVKKLLTEEALTPSQNLKKSKKSKTDAM